MSGPRLRRLGFALLLAVGALTTAPADAQDVDAFDVIIVVDDGAVTYNGDSIDGMADLEAALAEDVEGDPQLTVELMVHDTVPFEYVLKIMETIRQYDVYCKLEMVSRLPQPDDNM